MIYQTFCNMDYENKYKNALEKAKKIVNDKNASSVWKGWLCNCFPELKDSEDEIRKEIISALKFANFKGVYDKHLAWLEKQGEKSIIIDVDKMVLKYSQTMDGDFGLPINCQIRAYRQGVNDTLRLEKQGEQEEPQVYKTEDSEIITYSESERYKVTEPKFHEGEWILIDNPCQIESIDSNGDYIVRYCDTEETNLLSRNFCDSHYHLWTVQDAKDGDVLSYRDSQWIFIYKKQVDDNSFHYYSLYSTIYQNLTINDSAFTLLINSVVPATKEQRDLLFQKMKEAGYEWDAEKKELKKIELNEWVPKKGDICKPKKGGNNILLCDQDGIAFSFVEYVKNGGYAGGKIYIPTLLKEYELVEPKDYNTFDISFNAKDSELQEASYHIPEGFHAEIDENKVVIKKGEQNSTWSEDDEPYLEHIITAIKNYYTDYKGKENPFREPLLSWLKSLKERVVPQPKQEWSEEDEGILQSIILCLENLMDNSPTGCFNDFNKCINWLKSLSPQNRWKPSNEQLNNILDVLSFDNCTPKRRELLESLYNDLKKLKEK